MQLPVGKNLIKIMSQEQRECLIFFTKTSEREEKILDFYPFIELRRVQPVPDSYFQTTSVKIVPEME